MKEWILRKLKILNCLFLLSYTSVAKKIIGEEKAWALLENKVRKEKIGWLNRNRAELEVQRDLIDQACMIFYQGYFGFTSKDMDIVERTPSRLVTRWRVHCPVLEACKILHLDTREVCKKALERPAQDFLREISPKLKFTRNYETIRPHGQYCEETIEVID